MKEPKKKRLLKLIHDVLTGLYNAIYGFVLHSFKSINRKIKSKLPVWRMEEETLEHVHSAVRIFKWIVLPASLLYTFAIFCLSGQNTLDSALWGMLLFFYSSFLPDLPSIYRKRKKSNGIAKDLAWYKKYALLLFAPLLIWILFAGTQLAWRTTETFHNFKSLTVYGAFLLILGFLAYASFPIGIINLVKIASIPVYGTVGYLTHLKADKIW